jgi:predicted PurR-regulated permease PerM
MHISFQRAFYTLAFLVLLMVVMVVAKPVLISLGLALLISFILFPEHKRLMSWGLGSIPAALISILTVIAILGGIVTYFSTEIMGLSGQLDEFTNKLSRLFADVVYYINRNVSFIDNLNQQELLDNASAWLRGSGAGLAGRTFSSTAAIVAGLFTTIIYTFLLLIYHEGLVKAFMKFAPDGREGQFFIMLKNIQRVGQKYLSGMMLLIIILGLANSIGLWIIGIDSPFLFGFLAALLSIIPYVGTTLGATIPVLYAFISSDELWKPLAVAIMFWFIQVVESNFLSPKVVGNSVNVNALAAILSLLVGAAVWGLAGMVLFLPFVAMFKVVCDNYVELQPIGMMIGEDVFRKEKQRKSASLLDWLKKKMGRK